MDTGNWSEPETSYAKVAGVEVKPDEKTGATIYPFNKVYESESGHLIEIDDTAGSERISIHHRTGTFEEYHPNGDKVVKIVRDSYTSVLRDDYIHIDGYCNVTIDKALKILVNKDELPNSKDSAVNFDIEVGSNANVNLVINRGQCNILLKDGDLNAQLQNGDINLRQDKGNYNHFVNGDYNLEISGHMHVVTGGSVVNEIGGARDVRVDGPFDNLDVKGYKETTVAGKMNYTVAGGVFEQVGGSYETSIAGKRVIRTGGSVHEKNGGNHYIGCPQFHVSSVRSFISGSAGVDFWSPDNQLRLDENGFGLKTTGDALFNARNIHLNGPRVRDADRSSPPIDDPTFSTGSGGIWVKSVNHERNNVLALLTTMGELKNIEGTLNQLQEATKLAQDASNGLNVSIQRLQEISAQLEAGAITPEQAKNFMEQAQSITESANNLNMNISETLSTVDSVSAQASKTIDSALTTSESLIQNSTGGIGSSVGDVFDGIKSGIGGIADFVGGIAGGILDLACTISDTINNVVSGVFGAVGSAIGKVMGRIGQAISAVTGAIGGIISKVTGVIGTVFGKVGEIIGNVTGAIGGVIGDVIGGLTGILGGFGGGRPGNCGISVGVATPDFNVGFGISRATTP